MVFDMMKKRFAAVLAAFLLAVFCCPAIFAVNWDTSAEPGIAETTDPDATDYAVIAKTGGTQNEIGSTIMFAGIGFIAAGGIGLLCLIVWQVVSRRRDSAEEEREGVFEEIQQAEALSRRRRSAEEQAHAYDRRVAEYEEKIDEYTPRRTAPKTPAAPPKRYDPYSITGEIPLVPTRAAHTAERPIVPSTPSSLQPNAPRHAAPAVSAAKPAAPAARPTAPAVKPAAPAAKPVPAAKPAAAHKFDLDDILREVRESKEKQ